jgi:hypothetical protein
MFQNYTSTQFARIGLFFSFLFFFSFLDNGIYAQCQELNSVGLQTGLQGSKVGQSFTMNTCASGNFTSIMVTSVTNTAGDEPDNITLKIYQGSGYGGTVIHTQNDISFGIGMETINLSSAVPFTNGQTYTFSFEVSSGNFDLNRNSTGVNVYAGGTLFDASGNAITLDDLLFTVTTDALVLPVELTKFNAFQKDRNVELQWETASEYDNEGFEIERSTDGKEWENIGFVSGYGTTYTTQRYHFTDENPANGTNFYRLKQLDFDGRSEYSSVENVIFENNNGIDNIQIFPNPVSAGNSVNLNSSAELLEVITLIDPMGRVVFERSNLYAGEMIKLPNNLPSCIYSLVIKNENSQSTNRLIIQ